MSDRLTWEQRFKRDGSRWRYIRELEIQAEQVPVLRCLLVLSMVLNAFVALMLLFPSN